MSSEYDVVVIGSGYGGGVAASRVARAGQSVCVLEKGREIQPGDYPDELHEAGEEVQFSTPVGHVGDPTAMFEFHTSPDMNVLSGCGLGGGSLINAAVSMRAEERAFDDVRWPPELRDPAKLEPFLVLAEGMLRPEAYPTDQPKLAKLEAHELTAQKMGAKFIRARLNIAFEEGVNHVGVHQQECNSCGDCCSGCNRGAKNSTLMNYLPDARNHGAEIFTRCGVRFIERADDGKWVVHFREFEQGREGFEPPPRFVRADVVILAAGTIGSTEIMLRSAEQGLTTSDVLGTRFSGNGDVLGFAYNTEHEMNAVGAGLHDPEDVGRPGPCITGAIDLRGSADFEHGILIEEGAIPGALGSLLPLGLAGDAALDGVGGFEGGFRDWLFSGGRELESIFRGPYEGAVNRTLTYLVMCHDGAEGTLRLNADGHVGIDWHDVGDAEVYERVNDKLTEATEKLGGMWLRNPLWSDAFDKNLITTHPLGGCVMGVDATSGVVDHRGRVFSANAGTAVHDGLLILDSSTLPRSLGSNPLLTITALAERGIELLAADEERQWTIDYSLPSTGQVVVERKPGLCFTERMHGWFSDKVKTPTVIAPDQYPLTFEAARDQAEGDGSKMDFIFTIVSDDVEHMLEDVAHRAKLTGTIRCPALSPDALTVQRGTFQLFVRDPQRTETHLMVYEADATAEDGKQYRFYGEKLVHDDPGFDLWSDTTTLFVTVYDGLDTNAPIHGKGILRIGKLDFMRQLRTMKVTDAPTRLARLRHLARFGAFFCGRLFHIFGGAAAEAVSFDDPKEIHQPRKRRRLRAPDPEVFVPVTSDGVKLQLTRYEGGGHGPVILAPGFGVTASSFALDTVRTNIVEYLTGLGFDVWLFDFRASPDLPSAKTDFSIDDIATKDWPAAIQTVKDVTGAADVQVIAHCVGSMSLLMGLLAGLEGVRSAVCSQLTTHPSGWWLNDIKAALHVPATLSALGLDSVDIDVKPRWTDATVDMLLRLVPIPATERTNNPVDRRIFSLFGPSYKHAQLNDATLRAMHEWFGHTSVGAFEHLALIAREGHIVDFDGEDVYLPKLERLKLPLLFIAGADNQIFFPETSKKTYDMLVNRYGAENYRRHVYPHYAHMDCFIGRSADADIFPRLAKHLLEPTGREDGDDA